MDRGAERAELPGARRVARPRRDPPPARRAVGLPAQRRPVAARRCLVPAPQHRPPGPGRPVDRRRSRGRGPRPPRPERPQSGRHDHPQRDRGIAHGRPARRGDGRRGLGLADLARPARGHGRGPARPDPVEQVLGRRVDPRRRGVLLRPVPGAAGRRRPRRAEPRHGGPLPPPRGGPGGRPGRVRHARPPGVGLQPRGLGRRPAPRPHDLARHRPRESGLGRRARRRPHGRRAGAAPRRE